jgi:hypothetical protein
MIKAGQTAPVNPRAADSEGWKTLLRIREFSYCKKIGTMASSNISSRKDAHNWQILKTKR